MKRSSVLLSVVLTAVLLTACSLTPAQPPPAVSSALSGQESSSPLPDVQSCLSEQGAVLLNMWEDRGRTLVLYLLDKEDLCPSLALLDPETAHFTPLVNYIHPDSRIGIPDQNRVAVLDPGSDLATSYRSWPTIRYLTVSDHPLMVSVSSGSQPEPYHMPLSQGYSLGGHRTAQLGQVTLTHDQIYFEFQDDGSGSGTPQVQVSFQNELCTVLFPHSTRNSAFTADLCASSADPITLVSAQDTPEGAKLTFSCPSLPERANLTRWYMEEHAHPVTGQPGLSIHLIRDWGGSYPQGW